MLYLYNKLNWDSLLINQYICLHLVLSCFLLVSRHFHHFNLLSRFSPRYLTFPACDSWLSFRATNSCVPQFNVNVTCVDFLHWLLLTFDFLHWLLLSIFLARFEFYLNSSEDSLKQLHDLRVMPVSCIICKCSYNFCKEKHCFSFTNL